MKKKLFAAKTILTWLFIVTGYGWAAFAMVSHIRHHEELEREWTVQRQLLVRQNRQIDSLTNLLHIQVVDMDSLRTLCYIKTPANTMVNGG